MKRHCRNCLVEVPWDEFFVGHRCQACRSYWARNGEERPPEHSGLCECRQARVTRTIKVRVGGQHKWDRGKAFEIGVCDACYELEMQPLEPDPAPEPWVSLAHIMPGSYAVRVR